MAFCYKVEFSLWRNVYVAQFYLLQLREKFKKIFHNGLAPSEKLNINRTLIFSVLGEFHLVSQENYQEYLRAKGQ